MSCIGLTPWNPESPHPVSLEQLLAWALKGLPAQTLVLGFADIERPPVGAIDVGYNQSKHQIEVNFVEGQ